MKNLFHRITFCFLLLLAFLFPLHAQERTSTGFYYPLGRSTWNEGGGWLERDEAHGGDYFDGSYHIGEDMMASEGSAVYAIAAGTITYISPNGWGDGNVGVVIKHKLSDGTEFAALYGHVHTSKTKNSTVSAGESFATVGPYPYGNHLHFGIHPDPTMPANEWGLRPNERWPDPNGFVDPVDWLKTKSPQGSTPTFTVGQDAGSVHQPHFQACYNSRGGQAEIGTPINATHKWRDIRPVRIQDFQGGTNGDNAIIDDESSDAGHQAWLVRGALWSKYAADLGPDGILGRPRGNDTLVSSEVTGKQGLYQPFEFGGIYNYDANTHTFIVANENDAKYASLGRSTTVTGLVFPTSDQTDVVSSSGKHAQRSTFENGRIFHYDSNTFYLSGAINDCYSSLGGEEGSFGFPTSDLSDSVASSGAHATRGTFEDGRIFNYDSKTFYLNGEINNIYSGLGGEEGALGFPTSSQTDVVSSSGKHATRGTFEDGRIFHYDSNTFHVSGPINHIYSSLGGEEGSLGFPTSAPYSYLGGTRQDFEGGSLTYGVSLTLSFNPNTVVGGTSTTGTVTLSGAAPDGGAQVRISPIDALLGGTPFDITVPAGQTSTTFTLATKAPAKTQTLVVSAQVADVKVDANLTLTPDVPSANITSPSADEAFYTTLSSLKGTARAVTGRTITGVTLRLYRNATTSTPAGYWAGGTNWTTSASAANEIVATGTTSWTLALPALGDAHYSLRAAAKDSAGKVGYSNTRTFWIENVLPTLSISDAVAREGNDGTTPANFRITLSRASGRSVTVNYHSINGTATANGDFSAVPNTSLTFNPGETVKVVSVAVKGDLLNEADETFQMELVGAKNATLADTIGVGTVVNDDAIPKISISDAMVTEGDSGSINANFTVSLSAISGQTTSLSVATADGTATGGLDYTALPATPISFAPGQISKTVAVAIKGDITSEVNEQFQVKLSAPVNAALSDALGIGTILDNDGTPQLQVASSSVLEGNSGSVSLNFVLNLSKPSSRIITFKVQTQPSANNPATANLDYVPLPLTTITFAPGVTRQTVSVTINGDTFDEANERLLLAFSSPVNVSIPANFQVEGNILDDDAPPTLSINDVTMTEGDTALTTSLFKVTLSAPSGQTITVNYATMDGTAKAGSDYVTTNGTLIFAPGQTSKTIEIAIKGDTLRESTESFAVTLSGNVNAGVTRNKGFGTVLDNDAPAISTANNATLLAPSGQNS